MEIRARIVALETPQQQLVDDVSASSDPTVPAAHELRSIGPQLYGVQVTSFVVS